MSEPVKIFRETHAARVRLYKKLTTVVNEGTHPDNYSIWRKRKR